MHPDYESFCVEMPVNDQEGMEDFQAAMDAYHDELNKHLDEVANKLGICVADAMQIVYVRGRSRWTQELENRLVAAYKAGHAINCLSGEEEEQLKELGF